MTSSCSGGCGCGAPPATPQIRRILWVAMLLNAGMFVVEFAGAVAAHSSALTADSMDFLADAANYAIGLLVLDRAPRVRAGAALAKGLSLGGVGLWVVANSLMTLLAGSMPRADVMGGIGVLALAVNGGVALALWSRRDSDANMHSMWLCARNDAVGNLAVLAAAAGVHLSGAAWPDLAVAALLAWLPLSASVRIVRRAAVELAAP